MKRKSPANVHRLTRRQPASPPPPAAELARRGVASPAARARELQLLLEGSQSLMLIHGDRTIAPAAATAAKRLVTAPRRRR